MENFNNTIHQAKFALKTNWIQAVQILEDAVHKYPNEKEIYLELAEIYAQKQAYKKALENYQKVLNLDPDYHFARFKIGNIYLDMQEPKLALYHYEKIADKYPEALFNKALAYERLLMFEDAIDTLKVLIDNHEAFMNSYFLIVEIFFTLGKYSEALHYLNLMEDKFGAIPRVTYLKGIVNSYQKNWLVAYNKFLNIKNIPEYSSNSKLFHLLGIAAENVGQVDKAIEYLKHAITLRPSDKSIFIDLLKVLIRHKIITTREELKPYIEDMEDDVIKMAINLYETFKDELVKQMEGDLL